jgi:hypothetical protein
MKTKLIAAMVATVLAVGVAAPAFARDGAHDRAEWQRREEIRRHQEWQRREQVRRQQEWQRRHEWQRHQALERERALERRRALERQRIERERAARWRHDHRDYRSRDCGGKPGIGSGLNHRC